MYAKHIDIMTDHQLPRTLSRLIYFKISMWLHECANSWIGHFQVTSSWLYVIWSLFCLLSKFRIITNIFVRLTFSVYRLCSNNFGCWAGYRGVHCSGTKKCKFPTNTQKIHTSLSSIKSKIQRHFIHAVQWEINTILLIALIQTCNANNLCINEVMIDFVTYFFSSKR